MYVKGIWDFLLTVNVFAE